MLLKLLTKFQAYPFRSEVVSLTDNLVIAPRIAALGVPVHSLDLSKARPSLSAIWKARAIVSSFAPDLVQGWMYHGNVAASLSSAFLRKRAPVAWNIRASVKDETSVSWKQRALACFVAKLSTHPYSIIYNSEVSSHQHEALGYRSAGRVVIPNGFDCLVFRPSDEMRRDVRKDLQIPVDATLVGLIARYHPMKGHANFIKAAATVARRHPGVRFVFAGLGLTWDNVVLKNILSEQGLQDRVYLLGDRTDIPRLTAALDIACSSSTWGEGFSNAIGEAMACGVPCVVTDVGDSGRIVGDTGIVVPPDDPAAFTFGLERLISAGVEGRKALGDSARRRVEREYSLPAVARIYSDLYERIHASTRRPG